MIPGSLAPAYTMVRIRLQRAANDNPETLKNTRDSQGEGRDRQR